LYDLRRQFVRPIAWACRDYAINRGDVALLRLASSRAKFRATWEVSRAACPNWSGFRPWQWSWHGQPAHVPVMAEMAMSRVARAKRFRDGGRGTRAAWYLGSGDMLETKGG
jgi:hypothetical protein